MGRIRGAITAIWPFALLCVLQGSRWLVEGVVPASASRILTQAAGCGVAGLWVATWMWARRGSDRRQGISSGSWVGVIAAAAMLSAPALSQAIAGRFLNANNVTLALAMCPAVAAVTASAAGEAESADLTGLLWPGLAGVAGLLLLLPEPSFGAWRPWVGLGALPLLLGVSAVRFARGSRKEAEALQRSLAPGLFAGAAVLGVVAYLRRRAGAAEGLSPSAIALDGLTSWLMLRSLRALGPLRWSAQFLAIPLLGLCEGIFFLKPILDWRSWLGVGLLAVSACYQLAVANGASHTLSIRRPGDVSRG